MVVRYNIKKSVRLCVLTNVMLYVLINIMLYVLTNAILCVLTNAMLYVLTNAMLCCQVMQQVKRRIGMRMEASGFGIYEACGEKTGTFE